MDINNEKKRKPKWSELHLLKQKEQLYGEEIKKQRKAIEEATGDTFMERMRLKQKQETDLQQQSKFAKYNNDRLSKHNNNNFPSRAANPLSLTNYEKTVIPISPQGNIKPISTHSISSQPRAYHPHESRANPPKFKENSPESSAKPHESFENPQPTELHHPIPYPQQPPLPPEVYRTHPNNYPPWNIPYFPPMIHQGPYPGYSNNCNGNSGNLPGNVNVNIYCNDRKEHTMKNVDVEYSHPTSTSHQNPPRQPSPVTNRDTRNDHEDPHTYNHHHNHDQIRHIPKSKEEYISNFSRAYENAMREQHQNRRKNQTSKIWI